LTPTNGSFSSARRRNWTHRQGKARGFEQGGQLFLDIGASQPRPTLRKTREGLCTHKTKPNLKRRDLFGCYHAPGRVSHGKHGDRRERASHSPCITTLMNQAPKILEYEKSWRAYRLLRNTFVALLIGWVPIGLLVASVSERFRFGGWLIVPFLACWVLALSFVGFTWGTWRCPRCGRIYRDSLPYFPGRCAHCKLPKWFKSSVG
jgi:hypothetical protein